MEVEVEVEVEEGGDDKEWGERKERNKRSSTCNPIFLHSTRFYPFLSFLIPAVRIHHFPTPLPRIYLLIELILCQVFSSLSDSFVGALLVFHLHLSSFLHFHRLSAPFPRRLATQRALLIGRFSRGSPGCSATRSSLTPSIPPAIPPSLHPTRHPYLLLFPLHPFLHYTSFAPVSGRISLEMATAADSPRIHRGFATDSPGVGRGLGAGWARIPPHHAGFSYEILRHILGFPGILDAGPGWADGAGQRGVGGGGGGRKGERIEESGHTKDMEFRTSASSPSVRLCPRSSAVPQLSNTFNDRNWDSIDDSFIQHGIKL